MRHPHWYFWQMLFWTLHGQLETLDNSLSPGNNAEIHYWICLKSFFTYSCSVYFPLDIITELFCIWKFRLSFRRCLRIYLNLYNMKWNCRSPKIIFWKSVIITFIPGITVTIVVVIIMRSLLCRHLKCFNDGTFALTVHLGIREYILILLNAAAKAPKW